MPCDATVVVLQSPMMVTAQLKLGVKLRFGPAGVQWRSLRTRMPFAMKQNKLPDPHPIRLLHAQGKLLEAHHLLKLFAQSQLGIGNISLTPLGGFCRVHNLNVF